MATRKTGYKHDLNDVEKGKYAPIMQVLDCSTAHITKADDEILRDFSRNTDSTSPYAPNVIYTGYGYFIHVTLEDDYRDMLEGYKTHGLSDAFCKVMEYAREHNCAWVKFDCDTFAIKGLETFNW